MNGAVVLIWILNGSTVLLVSVWWSTWLYQHNPDVCNNRKGYFQPILVACLLGSCSFLTFGILRQDLKQQPSDPKTQSEITLAGGGVICVCTFAILLIWDCFCRGKAPHLVPSYWATIALLATSSLLVPGLTILAVYRTEIEETDENDDYYYVDYISALKWKGIGLVGAGGFIEFVVLSIWLRERFVTKRFGSTPTEEETQTYAGR